MHGGAWLIGIGLLAWLARDVADSQARRAIVLAFLICNSIGFHMALLAQLGAVLNALV
jgi:hypothetical protein